MLIDFGKKYPKKTIEWVFFHDPGYIYWMIEKDAQYNLKPLVKKRFDDLVKRASHLKIPGLCPWCKLRPVTRMFLVQHISGGLARVDFDCEECHPMGGSPALPLKPSFYSPDVFRKYDKTGSKFLVDEIKRVYFGSSSYRLTQKRLEDFFNDRDNFVNF